MHEYSLVSSLMNEIGRQVRSHQAAAVREVHLRLGELAGVDPELFRSAFDLIRPHTVCERAELSLTWERAVWRCPLCGNGLATGRILRCPDCHVPARLEGGRDLVLDRLELEVCDV